MTLYAGESAATCRDLSGSAVLAVVGNALAAALAPSSSDEGQHNGKLVRVR